MLDFARPEQGRHRRKQTGALWLTHLRGGVNAGLAKLVELQVTMIMAVALVLLGFMFTALATFFWFATADSHRTFVSSGIGIACLVSGCGFFIVFPPTSSPRHGKDS